MLMHSGKGSDYQQKKNGKKQHEVPMVEYFHGVILTMKHLLSGIRDIRGEVQLLNQQVRMDVLIWLEVYGNGPQIGTNLIQEMRFRWINMVKPIK